MKLFHSKNISFLQTLVFISYSTFNNLSLKLNCINTLHCHDRNQYVMFSHESFIHL